ncbi:MAG: glycosyltransferase family 1 protein [bacterium]
MKRIGIDARFWGEAGPGRYVSNLVKGLEKLDSENKYFIFLTPKGYKDFTPKNKNFIKVLADYRWYSFSEQLFYPKLLYQYNLDLLHFAQFNMPLLYFRPFTVTIHDMILHDYPIKKGGWKNKMLYPVKRLGYLVIFWWAARLSRAIVVPSEDAKKDLVTRLGIAPKKVTVTTEGFDKELRITNYELSIGKKILARYGVKKPYLLFVGSMYPHKNLERLVEAFALMSDVGCQMSDVRGESGRSSALGRLSSDIKLVLVGKESYFSKRLRQKVESMGLKNRVFFPGEKAPQGYVPDEDLPTFYQNAAAFVFPSLKEGFGIPPLEAMAFGVPVAASNASCVPEVCGRAALYFDPKNPSDMAEKISRLLQDKDLQKKLVAAGQENVKKFSWQKMAEQTLEVIQEVLNSKY